MTKIEEMIEQAAKAIKEGKTVLFSFGRSYGKRYFIKKVNQKLAQWAK